MTSISSSYNRVAYLKNALGARWWLLFITSLMYFFAGPAAFFLVLNRTVKQSINTVQALALPTFVHNWFTTNGVVAFYLIGIFSGIVFALLMNNYLQDKKQVNFYYSLPIGRGKLFASNYLVGLLIQLIPIFVMMGMMVLIGASFAGFAAIPLQVVAVHLWQISLFVLLSYSIAYLAGQLAGTVLTHLGMALLLHFGLATISFVFYMSCSVFFATFTGDAMFESIKWLSPTSAFIGYLSDHLSGAGRGGDLQVFSAMSLRMTATILAIVAVSTALGYVANKKRPSEKAGEALTFRFLQPIVKFVLMLIGATLAGSLFLSIGGGLLSYLFGLVAFAILIHMFSEVIINRDFKAMGKNMKTAVAFTAILVLMAVGMEKDITGYEKYIPESNNVAAAGLQLGYYYRNGDATALAEFDNIDLVCQIAKKITDHDAYLKNSDLHPLEVETFRKNVGDETTVAVKVSYLMTSGKETARVYNGVPLSLIAAEYAKLYDSEEYKRAIWQDVFALDLTQFTGINIQDYYAQTFFPDESQNIGLPLTIDLDKKLAEEFASALHKDLLARKYDIVQHGGVRYELRFVTDSDVVKNRTAASYEPIALYESDVHTMAILEGLAKEKNMTVIKKDDLWKQVKRIEIHAGQDGYELYEKDGPTQMATSAPVQIVTDEVMIKDYMSRLVLATYGDSLYLKTGTLIPYSKMYSATIYLNNQRDLLYSANMIFLANQLPKELNMSIKE